MTSSLLIKIFIDVNVALTEVSIFLRCLVQDDDVMPSMKMSNHEEVKPLMKEALEVRDLMFHALDDLGCNFDCCYRLDLGTLFECFSEIYLMFILA